MKPPDKRSLHRNLALLVAAIVLLLGMEVYDAPDWVRWIAVLWYLGMSYWNRREHARYSYEYHTAQQQRQPGASTSRECIKGEHITDSVVDLDAAAYVGCELVRCVIVWTGREPIHLTGTHVEDCRWEFKGPAGTTLDALRALYHAGFRTLVEQTIQTIRTPYPDEEEAPK